MQKYYFSRIEFLQCLLKIYFSHGSTSEIILYQPDEKNTFSDVKFGMKNFKKIRTLPTGNARALFFPLCPVHNLPDMPALDPAVAVHLEPVLLCPPTKGKVFTKSHHRRERRPVPFHKLFSMVTDVITHPNPAPPISNRPYGMASTGVAPLSAVLFVTVYHTSEYTTGRFCSDRI